MKNWRCTSVETFIFSPSYYLLLDMSLTAAGNNTLQLIMKDSSLSMGVLLVSFVYDKDVQEKWMPEG